MIETGICSTNLDDTYSVSTNERWLINRIMRYAQKKPDMVRIIAKPEDNDGMLYCFIPTNWLKISPPREYSEEQREIMRERLLTMGEKKA